MDQFEELYARLLARPGNKKLKERMEANGLNAEYPRNRKKLYGLLTRWFESHPPDGNDEWMLERMNPETHPSGKTLMQVFAEEREKENERP